MNKLFLGLFLSLNLTSTGAFASEEVECDLDDNSTIGLKICAGAEYEKADAKLNLVYKEIASKLKKSDDEMDKEILSRLVKAQKSWIAFRDAECDLQATEMLGGTGEGLINTSCLTELTNKRISDLKNFFAQ